METDVSQINPFNKPNYTSLCLDTMAIQPNPPLADIEASKEDSPTFTLLSMLPHFL